MPAGKFDQYLTRVSTLHLGFPNGAQPVHYRHPSWNGVQYLNKFDCRQACIGYQERYGMPRPADAGEQAKALTGAEIFVATIGIFIVDALPSPRRSGEAAQSRGPCRPARPMDAGSSLRPG